MVDEPNISGGNIGAQLRSSANDNMAATAHASSSAATGEQHAEQPAYTLEMVQRVRHQMVQATTQSGYAALQEALPVALVNKILEDAFTAIKTEPTLVEVGPNGSTGSCGHIVHADVLLTSTCPCNLLQINLPEPAEVIVVGDTHGQFHDVCKL